jgi:hypothetical protein
MNTAQRLHDVDKAYDRILTKAKEFFTSFAATFNGNVHFASVKIDQRSTPYLNPEATVYALGVRFDVTFDFTQLDQADWGRIRVTLPGKTPEAGQVLSDWYFDDLGNVRKTPYTGYASNLVDEKAFHAALLEDIEQAYFAVLNKTLPARPSP